MNSNSQMGLCRSSPSYSTGTGQNLVCMAAKRVFGCEVYCVQNDSNFASVKFKTSKDGSVLKAIFSSKLGRPMSWNRGTTLSPIDTIRFVLRECICTTLPLQCSFQCPRLSPQWHQVSWLGGAFIAVAPPLLGSQCSSFPLIVWLSSSHPHAWGSR